MLNYGLLLNTKNIPNQLSLISSGSQEEFLSQNQSAITAAVSHMNPHHRDCRYLSVKRSSTGVKGGNVNLSMLTRTVLLQTKPVINAI